jgi:hypothetical protein
MNIGQTLLDDSEDGKFDVIGYRHYIFNFQSLLCSLYGAILREVVYGRSSGMSKSKQTYDSDVYSSNFCVDSDCGQSPDLATQQKVGLLSH